MVSDLGLKPLIEGVVRGLKLTGSGLWGMRIHVCIFRGSAADARGAADDQVRKILQQKLQERQGMACLGAPHSEEC